VSWSSNNEAVATVTQGGLIRGKSAGNATITVKTEDGGFTDSCVVTVIGAGTTVPATGVELNKKSMNLVVSGSEALTATVTPSNASNKNVTWSSSNEAVATVIDGFVTGESAGTAIITVRTVSGGFTDSCTVTVTSGAGTTVPVTGVTLDKKSISLGIDNTDALTATVLPENASNKNVIWTSSNNDVATVSNGLVKGVSSGTATITVMTIDGNFTDSCTVAVTSGTAPVTGVTLNKKSMSLAVNASETLTATVMPENAANKSLLWGSSNYDVASVSNGLVRGISAGTANITVITIDGNFSDSCTVTVTSGGGGTIPVTGVKMNTLNTVVNIGGYSTIIATVMPENASNKNVTWSSSSPAIATVADGVVTGVTLGSVTVTVKTEDGNFTDECTVTVGNALIPVTGIALHGEKTLFMKVGETQQLNASVIPENATIQGIAWYSTNMEVALVSGSGEVRALKSGITTISAVTDDGNFSVECSVTVSEADPLPPEETIYWVNHQNSTNVESAASEMPDFIADDLEIKDGKVCIKKSIAEEIFKELISDDMEDINGIKVVPLPWFKAAVEFGKIAAVRIPVKGSQLDFDYPRDIRLLKILTPKTGVLLTSADTKEKFADGSFTLMDKESDEPVSFSERINMSAEYDLVVFIKDGGDYDLDKVTNGFVVDPIAIVGMTWPGRDDEDEGCNAGYGGSISLLLTGLALFSVRRKK
jgi:uncharacterized protein YjdB